MIRSAGGVIYGAVPIAVENLRHDSWLGNRSGLIDRADNPHSRFVAERDRVSRCQDHAGTLGARTILAAPLLREGIAIGADRDSSYGGSSVYREADRASRDLCRPGCDRDRERAACSKNCRSATRNCARPWSIRRQRPRCSASSAARRRMCSRCSTPSSRARREFVGSMTWCCDFTRGTLWFRGLILVPYSIGRAEISMDEPAVSLDREHGTLHIPDVRAAERFSNVGSPAAGAPS